MTVAGQRRRYFLAVNLGWPLIPLATTSIFLPDCRNSLVCSAIDSEVSLAAADFLEEGLLVGSRAMVVSLSGTD